MRLHTHKGKNGNITYYLNIPKKIVEQYGINPNDEFDIIAEAKGNEVVLVYTRVKK